MDVTPENNIAVCDNGASDNIAPATDEAATKAVRRIFPSFWTIVIILESLFLSYSIGQDVDRSGDVFAQTYLKDDGKVHLEISGDMFLLLITTFVSLGF